ncbi:hypothetical protein JS533_000060 [Bifidobacterium amazonense]|uniref:Carbohydrate ABC transporter permease n=1 Tax=Bifidobacterium amazonense TaxID=2809027 RepID=A0ABS9VRA0_9BIFI|nr:hypothetical protein [Bifidobacterium amazonense]MCH9274688.1 hypothetical protein [Bifidobacterium amazonense]
MSMINHDTDPSAIRYGNASEFGAKVAQVQASGADGVRMPEGLEHKRPDRAWSTRRSGRQDNQLKRFLLVGFLSVFVLAFLYVPMMIVVFFSFNGGK